MKPTNRFVIEINTSSEYPTVDVQHMLYDLAAALQGNFGEAKSEELPSPLSFMIEGVTGTLFFSRYDVDDPGDTSPSGIDEFLDDLTS